jgi:hypothetical protein
MCQKIFKNLTNFKVIVVPLTADAEDTYGLISVHAYMSGQRLHVN